MHLHSGATSVAEGLSCGCGGAAAELTGTGYVQRRAAPGLVLVTKFLFWSIVPLYSDLYAVPSSNLYWVF